VLLHEPLNTLSFPLPEFRLNEAEALFDNDAYREMVAMVSRARKSIRIEFYLFGGPVSEAIIDVLIQKIAEGVSVQVTLDRALGFLPQVKRECRVAYQRLLKEGIDVVLTDPRPFPDSPKPSAVIHNKLLVIDDKEALVGGMNVGSLFFRHHDVMIFLKGPAALALGQQFDHDRQFVLEPRHIRPTGSHGLPLLSHIQEGSGRQTWARLLGTGVSRRTTKEAILERLRTARSSVFIAMGELGRTDVLNEVIAAKERGLDIRVLVDPQDIGVYLPVFLGGLRRYITKGAWNALAVRELLLKQVTVQNFEVGKEFDILHLKMAIFDETSAIVGSTNWTNGGFGWVGETDIELRGGQVIGQLLNQFSQDWERSSPATMPSFLARSACRVYEHLFQ
jgi:phosphatidylserine/phosphatidylglycerophosphate/cardiolipin synthase-like enzyme